MESLFEAFENLEDIDDLMLSASINDVEKIKAFKEGDEVAIEYQKIIDPLARTEDELEGNYLGKKILQCCVCHSLLYKDEEDIRFNEDETVANEGEECPTCFSTEGFKVVGEVTPLKDDTLYTEDDEQFELARDVKDILEKFYRKSNEVDFEPLFKLETNGTLELDKVREKLLEEPKAIKDELLSIVDLIEKGRLTNIAEPESIKEVVKKVSELIPEEEEIKTEEETKEDGEEVKVEDEVKETEFEECYTKKSHKEKSGKVIEESFKNEFERLEKVLDKLNWKVKDVGDEYEIETWSPAGENLIEYLDKEDIIESVKTIYDDFDPDEHVEMWIEAKRSGTSGVPSVSVLIEDARAIDGMYYDLRDAIEKEFGKDELKESTERDDIDADADDKKEIARRRFVRRVDDADADRDYKLKRRGLRENTEDVTDQVIIKVGEPGYLTKKRELEEKGYKRLWAGEGKICMTKPKEVKEECKESVTPRDKIDAEADNKKELAKKRFMRAKDDADADKDYRLKKAGLKETVSRIVKFAVPSSEIEKVKEKIAEVEFEFNPVNETKGYVEFEVIGDSKKEDKWEKIRNFIKEINRITNVVEYPPRIVGFGKEEKLTESDKPAATSIEDAQKWVDYDMKKYGRISRETNRLVRRAGFQIIKDQYGDYEVTARDYERPEEENEGTKEESLKEDTVKVRDGKWVNKGKEGTHGTFRTKKAADEQRKAMFARAGKNRKFGENLKEAKYNHLIYSNYLVDSDDKIVGEFLGREEAKELAKKIKDTAKDYIYVTKESIYEGDEGRVSDFEEIVDAFIVDGNWRINKDKFGIFKEDLAEGFNKVNIETDDYKMDMTSDENGKVVVTTEPLKKEEFEGNAETITPLTDEESEELTKVATETPEEEVEVDFDEIDEESFNEISESYMKRVYENINSFKITKATSNDTELKLEGVINFKSGKKATTNFVFESKEMDKKNGRLKFVGENKQFAKGRKSFTLNCSVKGNKLVTESLNYNYRGKDAKTGLTKKLYGTVKK